MGISSYKTSSVEFVGTAAGIPASAPEGQLYYETDQNQFDLYEDGGWKWFSPPMVGTLAQRPDATYAHQGRIFIATDTDQVFIKTSTGSSASWVQIGSYGALTSYTPTLSQGASTNIAKTVSVSEYQVINGVCEWWFKIDPTASGTAGSGVVLTLPVTAAAAGSRHIGAGMIYDATASTVDTGSFEMPSTSTLALHVSEGTGAFWGQTPNIAIATGDSIRGHVRYRVI